MQCNTTPQFVSTDAPLWEIRKLVSRWREREKARAEGERKEKSRETFIDSGGISAEDDAKRTII